MPIVSARSESIERRSAWFWWPDGPTSCLMLRRHRTMSGHEFYWKRQVQFSFHAIIHVLFQQFICWTVFSKVWTLELFESSGKVGDFSRYLPSKQTISCCLLFMSPLSLLSATRYVLSYPRDGCPRSRRKKRFELFSGPVHSRSQAK